MGKILEVMAKHGTAKCIQVAILFYQIQEYIIQTQRALKIILPHSVQYGVQ